MKRLSFRVRTIFVGMALCALLLTLARYCGPREAGSLVIAGGVEPHPHFLESFAQQLETTGYTKSRSPACIMCIEGDWKWYRNENNPSLTIGVDRGDQACLVEIWYERPWWLPIDLGTTEMNAQQLARELEAELRSLLALHAAQQEIHRSSDGESTFLIGSFDGR